MMITQSRPTNFGPTKDLTAVVAHLTDLWDSASFAMDTWKQDFEANPVDALCDLEDVQLATANLDLVNWINRDIDSLMDQGYPDGDIVTRLWRTLMGHDGRTRDHHAPVGVRLMDKAQQTAVTDLASWMSD